MVNFRIIIAVCQVALLIVMQAKAVAAGDVGPYPPLKLLPPVTQEATQGQAASNEISPEYVLGPGDQLTVVNFSEIDLEAEEPAVSQVPILPDGTVNIYPVGVLRVAGLTVRQLNEVINKKALKFFKSPQILITVSRIKPAVVYVLGEVANPGLYSTQAAAQQARPEGEIPAAATGFTLVSVLQRAGGVKESADVRNVTITRLSAGKPIKADLWKLMAGGDVSQDIVLQSGDAVFVPRGGSDYDQDALGVAADRTRRVRVLGDVKQPGLYDLRPDDDILSMIAKAGGLTDTSLSYSVLLSRVNRDGTITRRRIPIRGSLRRRDALGRKTVKPGDVLVVGHSRVKEHIGKFVATALGLATASTVLVLSRNIRDNSQRN